MGLEFWCVGNKQLNDGTDVWVHYLWQFDVEPSCSSPWTLAGMCADVDGRAQGRFWRGLWTRRRGGVKANVASDPVVDSLNEIRLFEVKKPTASTFGGVSYRVNLQTPYLKGDLSFSNPEMPNFVRLEQAALEYCRQLVLVSHHSPLAECIELWEGYLG